MTWKKQARILGWLVAIILVAQAGCSFTMWRIAVDVSEQRAERQLLQMIEALEAEGLSPEDIQTAIENYNRSYRDGTTPDNESHEEVGQDQP